MQEPISRVVVAVVAAAGVACARTPSPAVSADPGRFEPTVVQNVAAPSGAPPGMVWVPGGEFSMGSDASAEALCEVAGITKDAVPIHRVAVAGFWMDATEVTNEQFTEFVNATGYRTVAERPLNPADFPGVAAASLVPGSAVFRPPSAPVPLGNALQWWTYMPGASWRHPQGPGSTIDGRARYPVVHVAHEDAVAYATWRGHRLPTEAEWEFAARGGRSGELFAWGNELVPGGVHHANIHQGSFPDHDTGADGVAGVAPVSRYAANAYGLFDMAGNVWEWVGDWYRPDYYATLAAAGPVANNPQGPPDSHDPGEPGARKRVQRGGSFLCSDQYCSRYLVGTRGKSEVSSSSDHVGFRTVRQ